ncbi:sugar ABC transporter substrate-binding protein [Gryllotalpicola daejeonensis]|uniref:Sugar ABC transporter substrate-binding protein n=1 Tax=Gryllotalpicola daejeonensis TaxID=993087 RepID=A0ABP7ZJ83_9MICO
MSHRTVLRALTLGAIAAVLGGTLVACSNSSSDNGGSAASGSSASKLDAALKKGGEISYWTWTPQAKDQVAAFEKAYPKVKVDLVNTQGAGTSNTKVQNAISAGKGVPDVTQVEYQSLPLFQLQGDLVDLTKYGFGDLKSKYTDATWNAVSQNGGIWGLPQDSAPMALFYNKTVFDQYHLTVPKTWDEYIADAKKLHQADPSKWLIDDAGDAGVATSLMWQAGGHPFQVKGTNVTINLQDDGSKKYAQMYNQLIADGSLGTIPGWSDEWYKDLGNGTIATLLAGGWMPGVLSASAPEGKGHWAVAPLPTWDGTPANAENGGSTEVIPKLSKNQDLAAAFLRWLNSDPESIKVFIKDGGFPSTNADLNDPSFIDQTSDYFGGQKIYQTIVPGAKNDVAGWSYLPWQAHANDIFGDSVGKAIANKTDINKALQAWQDANVSYGKQQGFKVSAG